jgi:hypothetical protein
MVELAARYRYTMDGESLLGSEDDYQEESNEPSSDQYSAGRGKSRKPRRTKDHKGMKYSDMMRIFAVLVRLEDHFPCTVNTTQIMRK